MNKLREWKYVPIFVPNYYHVVEGNYLERKIRTHIVTRTN